MMFVEFDLAGAEWVVVAYLSGDPRMLEVVRSGKSPHIVTGSLITGCPEDLVLQDHKLVGSSTDPELIRTLRKDLAIPEGAFVPRSMSMRQAGKKSNHGLNYDMRYRRFALENEMQESDAEPIVEFYRTKAYPDIFNIYHEDVRRELKDNGRCLVTCFGRRVRLLDAWGPNLFMAAYSFKPQSTVFDCVRVAMVRAYRDSGLELRPIRLGAQVHDSLMMRYPIPRSLEEWQHLAVAVIRIAREYMRPQLRYRETDFRLNCDAKLGVSWGRMHSFTVDEDVDRQVEHLRHTVDAALEGERKLADLALEAQIEAQSAAAGAAD